MCVSSILAHGKSLCVHIEHVCMFEGTDKYHSCQYQAAYAIKEYMVWLIAS